MSRRGQVPRRLGRILSELEAERHGDGRYSHAPPTVVDDLRWLAEMLDEHIATLAEIEKTGRMVSKSPLAARGPAEGGGRRG